MDAPEAFARHERIAFQFSGGRDSTTALFLLRPWWNRMTVYHVDAGDQFPEVREVVFAVGLLVPVHIIGTDARAVREELGLPSDVVPFDNTTMGRVLSGRQLHITGRMDCCSKALMQPLHQRMLADGMTLLVRGVRRDEFAGDLPIRSGWSDGQVEMLYPIEDWSAADVDAYIAANGIPVAPFYAAGMKQAPECMGCTAWWDEGRSAYMRERHPLQYAVVQRKMAAIRGEIGRQLAQLDDKENDHG